ncbi:hypothetical protein CC86DRAFT_366552 [Ophiobolus disseminans]|uniref:DUF7730 domain-containing protein n=1 Tax=Ophiobolus disseminans TaxID=1469910 RepID=A0A6A7AEC8_9PLEO|nr:hypothetical protein CC86DRAFT_366552 [Ophiobolus disseminans]
MASLPSKDGTQVSCLLLLPVELRDTIYIYTLGGNVFEIDSDGRPTITERYSLNLLLTSRQIYSEARLHVYRHNTFAFLQTARWLIFLDSRTQEQVEAIQSLQLLAYTATRMRSSQYRFEHLDLRCLERLKGLKRVVTVDYTPRRGDMRREDWEQRARDLAEGIWSWKRAVEVGARYEWGEWEMELGTGRE